MTQTLFRATSFPSVSLFLCIFDGFDIVANVKMCRISGLETNNEKKENEKEQKVSASQQKCTTINDKTVLLL